MNGGAVSYEAQVEEACATIRKAVEQINEGFAMDGQNLSPQTFNQLSRWVSTKDEHANLIIELTREKIQGLCREVDDELLKVYHRVKTEAMKAKQSTEPSQCTALENAVRKCVSREKQTTMLSEKVDSPTEQRMKTSQSKILYIILTLFVAWLFLRKRR